MLIIGLMIETVRFGDKMSVKSDVFVEHIQKHLDKKQLVVCKICGKSIDEIYNEFLETN